MFTQREEQWTGSDDSGNNSRYRRRITHEDICRCDILRRSAISRYKALRSSSLNWRQPTDYCAGFSDQNATVDPARLWYQNDLSISLQRDRSEQRRCRSYDQLCDLQRCCCCCSCSCSCRNRHYRGYRGGTVRHRHECWDTWDPPLDDSEQQFVDTSENLGMVRMVPVAFVASPTAKTTSKLYADDTASNSENTEKNGEYMRATDATPYYGPFIARKVRISPATVATNTTGRSRSVQEHYSSERKYMRDIQNDKPPKSAKNFAYKPADDTKIPVPVKEEMRFEANDFGTAKGAENYRSSGTAMRIRSEFPEIPFSSPTVPRIHIHAESSPSLTTIGEKKEAEVPKKMFHKSAKPENNLRESGRETLIEGLELLKSRKQEQEQKSVLVKTSYADGDEKRKSRETSPKLPEKLPDIPEKPCDIPKDDKQMPYVDEFLTSWPKKTGEDHRPPYKIAQEPEPPPTDHSLHDAGRQQDTSAKSQTETINDDDVPPPLASSESKFIMEIRRAREKLRKVSRDSEVVASYGNEPKVEDVLRVREQRVTPPKQPQHPSEIVTFYSPQPFISSGQDWKNAEFRGVLGSRTFRVTAKTESKQEDIQKTALPSATIHVSPSSTELPGNESSRYTGRKHETISAEIYIRNPQDPKPAVINVSAGNEENKKPRWMILKAFESPPGTLVGSSQGKESQGTKIQIRSNLAVSTEATNSKDAEFSEGRENFATSAASDVKQLFEKSQIKSGFFEDSKSRSEADFTVWRQGDTRTKSEFQDCTQTIHSLTTHSAAIQLERKLPAFAASLPNGIEASFTWNTVENCKFHHTAAFEQLLIFGDRTQICRRGASILFTLQHNTKPEILDNISVFFRNVSELANYESTVSLVNFKNVSKQTEVTAWHGTYKILTSQTVLFEVVTPADIPVGLWQMTVKYGDSVDMYSISICMLFNPWDRGDETYYPNEVELEEYVMNELAVMRKWNRNDAWLLGQFSVICIEAVLHLLALCLEDRLLKADDLGSAYAVVKAIAIAISKFILEVKWNDFAPRNYSFENCTVPSAWTGSKEIIATYRKMGARVGYGQSWCYAGLLTSFCRCLGIPCRMVTIYNFAPQVDDDMLIKLDLIDDILAEKSKDTIWHYHIWNELWLHPALFKEDSQWHVCDATPTSKERQGLLPGSAIFPVARIKKNGGIMRQQNEDEYFGRQLYGMLNAIIVCNYYHRDPTTRSPLFAYSKKLKKKLCSKVIFGTADTETDITSNYKRQENFGTLPDSSRIQTSPLLEETRTDEFDFYLSDFQNIRTDEPVNGYLIIASNSLLERTVTARIQVDLTCYTGLVNTHVYLFEELLIVPPKQRRKIEFRIPIDFFQNMFTEDWDISITAFARVFRTDERFYMQQILTPLKPELSIKRLHLSVNETILAEKERFEISMTNPLSLLLTGCEIRIDGSGLLFQDSPISCGSVAAHGSLSITIAATRISHSSQIVVAVFNCDQLKNVRTFYTNK